MSLLKIEISTKYLGDRKVIFSDLPKLGNTFNKQYFLGNVGNEDVTNIPTFNNQQICWVNITQELKISMNHNFASVSDGSVGIFGDSILSFDKVLLGNGTHIQRCFIYYCNPFRSLILIQSSYGWSKLCHQSKYQCFTRKNPQRSYISCCPKSLSTWSEKNVPPGHSLNKPLPDDKLLTGFKAWFGACQWKKSNNKGKPITGSREGTIFHPNN